ncbi:hypothetical protein [Terribacillus saccharophilus]|uniref:hypothetical protein n=1 Tax=Terribacillus saccharophilus TaxID=361277 RepID=UPI003D28FD9B
MYLKISNFKEELERDNVKSVSYDYKGLNQALIESNSVIIPDEENVCYLKYLNDSPVIHADVIEISEAFYKEVTVKIGVIASPPNQEERLRLLEQAVNDLIMGGSL